MSLEQMSAWCRGQGKSNCVEMLALSVSPKGSGAEMSGVPCAVSHLS
jgi:hypothetical protein